MAPMPDAPDRPSPTPDAPSALPSVGARVLAFVAIVLAGAAGAFIGYAFADLQCTDGDCGLEKALFSVLGGVVAAVGTAVVVVLTLRAMGEWRTMQARSPEQGRQPPEGGTRRPPRVR